MVNREIAYDLRLEELYDKVRMQMWMSEELQLQPKRIRDSIIKIHKELIGKF